MRVFLWEILASVLMLFVLSLFSPAHAQSIPAVDIDIIAKIESNFNPDANSFAGAKHGRGVCQISEIALRDWNKLNPKDRYRVRDLYNPQVNMKISNWLFEERIPQLLKHYGYEVNLENIICAYNAGISNVKRWKKIIETVNYIKKYKRLAKITQ